MNCEVKMKLCNANEENHLKIRVDGEEKSQSMPREAFKFEGGDALLANAIIDLYRFNCAKQNGLIETENISRFTSRIFMQLSFKHLRLRRSFVTAKTFIMRWRDAF
jgi:hypothetical protein